MQITKEKELKEIAKFIKGEDWKDFWKDLSYELDNRGEIHIDNTFNDKLFCFCKKEMKEEAKKLGIIWDHNFKSYYIPKTLNRDNVKKLLELEMRLYGDKWGDYHYKIIIPKQLSVYKMMDGTYNIGHSSITEGLEQDSKSILKMFPKKKIAQSIKLKLIKEEIKDDNTIKDQLKEIFKTIVEEKIE